MKTNEWGTVKTNDGHLSLKNIFCSGNIVPKKKVKDKDFHYYIMPNVDQTITYLALIKEPKDFLQVKGEFSLEQERIFPETKIGKMKLMPHTAMRTFQIDNEGILIKNEILR